MCIKLLFKFPQFFLETYSQFNGVAVFLHHKHQQLIDFTACFLQYFTHSRFPTKRNISTTQNYTKS